MPAAVKKPAAAAAAKSSNPLLEEKRPKSFGARHAPQTQARRGAHPICNRAGIGGALPPKTPLNRYVKWPKYVRIQRQRRVLTKRLKVRQRRQRPRSRSRRPHPRSPRRCRPRSTSSPRCWTRTSVRHVFCCGYASRCAWPLLTLRAAAATNLFKLLLKYRPEDKKEKKVRQRNRMRATAPAAHRARRVTLQERLLKKAEAEKDGKAAESKKPIVVKFGINHITYLVEQARSCSSCFVPPSSQLTPRCPRLASAGQGAAGGHRTRR